VKENELVFNLFDDAQPILVKREGGKRSTHVMFVSAIFYPAAIDG